MCGSTFAWSDAAAPQLVPSSAHLERQQQLQLLSNLLGLAHSWHARAGLGHRHAPHLGVSTQRTTPGRGSTVLLASSLEGCWVHACTQNTRAHAHAHLDGCWPGRRLWSVGQHHPASRGPRVVGEGRPKPLDACVVCVLRMCFEWHTTATHTPRSALRCSTNVACGARERPFVSQQTSCPASSTPPRAEGHQPTFGHWAQVLAAAPAHLTGSNLARVHLQGGGADVIGGPLRRACARHVCEEQWRGAGNQGV
jgi:hypothetical protein